jgi:hypothetical protein
MYCDPCVQFYYLSADGMSWDILEKKKKEQSSIGSGKSVSLRLGLKGRYDGFGGFAYDTPWRLLALTSLYIYISTLKCGHYIPVAGRYWLILFC